MAELATYAAKHGERFRRVEAVAEIDGGVKLLDLTEPKVRQAISTAASAEALYRTTHAATYGG